ncbi:MAG: hypothetical protein NTW78_02900 [Campylobacterales bacterium]|nr:hypothetical protein [Campylobacterales bacterium]
MKKILLLLSLILAIAALIPVLGNKLIENKLDENIEVFKTNGMEIIESKTDSNYLQTKKHYEFLLKDAKKVVEHLNKLSNEKFLPYSHAMLEGILVGVDLDYSNIPLSKALSIDIYPLKLSDRVMSDMQNKDAKLSEYIKSFLQNRGVLLHVNYNLLSRDFDGYIKDINEQQNLKSGAQLTLNLLKTTYSGSGELIAPTKLHSNVNKMMIRVADNEDEFLFNIQDFSTDARFESQTTYTSAVKLEKLEMLTGSKSSGNIELNISGMVASVSSNMQGVKGEMNAKNSINSIVVNSKELDLNASNFNYDIALQGMDKDSFEEVRMLASKIKTDNTGKAAENLQDSFIKLLSCGLTLDVNDFSIQKVMIDNAKDLEGFSIKSKATIKEDSSLKDKIKNSPALVVKDVNMHTNLKFSKAMFNLAVEKYPMVVLAKEYAKDEAKSLVYDFSFIDGAFKINDKPLNF